MTDTRGKPIQCKAAVWWGPKQPLSIETVTVAPPKAGEVRVKITHTGICHSDANILNGELTVPLPVILGHEAAGIIESVGDNVTYVKPGDHVLPIFLPECGKCRLCKSDKTNLCEEFMRSTDVAGVLPDETSRFTCNGQPVYQSLVKTSTFSQYSTMSTHSVVKIDSAAPLNKVCLLSCGIGTGYGTAINTAKVEPGSVCAVWGLGCIGLAAVMGCKAAGASRIIGIDINPDKFEIGKKFGLTEFINPSKCEKPLNEVIMDITEGGLDYAFEAVGNVNIMKGNAARGINYLQDYPKSSSVEFCSTFKARERLVAYSLMHNTAFDSLQKGWGKLSLIGLAPQDHEWRINPFKLLLGRTITGACYGGFKPKEQVPELVEMYMRKEIMVDEFISHTMPLDKINYAFDLMRERKSLRSVVEMF